MSPLRRALLVLSFSVSGCAAAAPPGPIEALQPAQASGAPRAPEAPKTPEAPKAPEAPNVTEAPKTFDVAAIDAYVARQVTEKRFVGLSLALLQNGKVVLARGYGKSSLAAGAAVEVDTAFAVGSITKQLASACVFLLAEDGKLSVDDKVAKYYPKLTRAGEITLYDLMTHTSGYPDYYPLDFVDRRMEKPIAHDQLIQEYAGRTLDFDPGTRFSYSNTGYVILGRVVEKVSGEPFGKFLERRILKPLGMDHTVFEPKAGGKGLAAGHTAFALGEPEATAPEGEGWLHAAGGLYSTAPDLMKWNLALMEGKVLRPASFQRMTAPRRLKNGKTETYGCGLGISQRSGETVLAHSGAVSGFLAYSAMVPRTKSSTILLTNGDYLDAGALQREILALLLKQEGGSAPKVEGASPKEVALEMLHQMQTGALDRSKLSEELNHYLTDTKVRGAAARLAALGEPTRVEVENVSERGGMEVATIRFTFKAASAKALLYRSPDGKIQQFLLYRA